MWASRLLTAIGFEQKPQSTSKRSASSAVISRDAIICSTSNSCDILANIDLYSRIDKAWHEIPNLEMSLPASMVLSYPLG